MVLRLACGLWLLAAVSVGWRSRSPLNERILVPNGKSCSKAPEGSCSSTRVKGSTSCATGWAALSVPLLRYQAAALCRSPATTWRGASRSPMRKAAPGPWTGWANQPPHLGKASASSRRRNLTVLAVEGRGTALSRYEDGLCSSQEAHNTESGPGVVRLCEHRRRSQKSAQHKFAYTVIPRLPCKSGGGARKRAVVARSPT